MFEIVNNIDTSILQIIYNLRQADWVVFFRIITRLCDLWFAVFLVIFFVFLFLYEHKYRTALTLVVSSAGSSAIAYILKFLISRPRPPINFAVFVEPSYSFPSSHAAAVVAIYGFLFFLLYKKVLAWRRNLVFILGCLVILLVGFSRIYLGVHYFTDIIGGYIIGFIWLWLSIRLSSSVSLNSRK